MSHMLQYLRHPAYRNYPVVGVNWSQANDYCNWRTDRVNERILINEGLKEDIEQVDDNTFNTEAYLAGQYEGIVKKNRETMIHQLVKNQKNKNERWSFIT